MPTWSWPPGGSPPTGGLSAFSQAASLYSSGSVAVAHYHTDNIFPFTSGIATSGFSPSGVAHGYRGATRLTGSGAAFIATSGPLIEIDTSGGVTSIPMPSKVYEGLQLVQGGVLAIDTGGNIYNSSGTQVNSFANRPVGFSNSGTGQALATATPLATGGPSISFIAALSGAVSQTLLPGAVINPMCMVLLQAIV